MAPAPVDFDALLDEATLAETEPIPICLNGKLRAQYVQVKHRMDQRAAAREAQKTPGDDRLATKDPGPDPEQPELDRLVEQIRRHTVEFVLRALPKPEWNELFAEHPPRNDRATGKRHERDGLGVNYDTFFPALVRRSIVSPELTGERWQKLYAKLSDAQFNKLANEAWAVNQTDVNVPFLLSGSPSHPTSGES